MTKYFFFFLLNLYCFDAMSQDCGFEVIDSNNEKKRLAEWFCDKLFDQELILSFDKKDMPESVKKQLVCYYNRFDLANPDEDYQIGCLAEDDLPANQLVFLAKNDNYLVINYNTYSVGVSNHHIWIKYNKEGISDFWYDNTFGRYSVDEKFDLNDYIERTLINTSTTNN